MTAYLWLLVLKLTYRCCTWRRYTCTEKCQKYDFFIYILVILCILLLK